MDLNQRVEIPGWFLWLVGLVLIPIVALVGHIKLKQGNLETRLSSVETTATTTSSAIKKQTEEIVGLRLQIERLLVVSPSDVYRKMQEIETKIESIVSERDRN